MSVARCCTILTLTALGSLACNQPNTAQRSASAKASAPSSSQRASAQAGPTGLGLDAAVPSLPPSVNADSERWDPASTHAVIVGALTFKDPAILPFSNRHRKDQELADLLVSRGVKKRNLTLLLDEAATADGVFKALEAAAAAAPADSTFLFYYAGHGDKSDKGVISFVAYDSSSDKKTNLTLARIERTIEKNFKGKRILLLADACYSGGLLDVATSLTAKGFAAVALTSAESSNLSTGNWTFTQTLIDSLSGLPVSDRNADGKVDIGELADEARDAMKYRERQRSGVGLAGLPRTFVVADTKGSGWLRQNTPLEKGAYLEVSPSGSVEVGRVLDTSGSTVDVELYHYSDKSKVQVQVADAKPPVFQRFPASSKIHVYWKNKAYDAEVKRVEGDFHFITYTGFESYWDEWVLSDRIAESEQKAPTKPANVGSRAFAVGDKVKIDWQGKQYPGSVLQVKDGKYFVHYDGYGKEWDEWAVPARVHGR